MRPLATTFLALCLAFSVCTAEDKQSNTVLLPSPERTFTSADGRQIEARLLAVNHEAKTLSLEVKGGKRMDGVPFAKFSQADQEYIARCRAQQRRTDRITNVEGGEEEMTKAIAEARRTFPEAWKKIEADGKRRTSGYDRILLKAEFTDPPAAAGETPAAEEEHGEHMWIGDFSFDGKSLTGTLLNAPNALKSVKMGDKVTFPLERLSDWIFVSKSGKIEGGFTEKLLHRRMSPEERKEHNEATGLNWDQ